MRTGFDYEEDIYVKFSSKPIPEHEEVPLADGGQWECLVDKWTQVNDIHSPDHGSTGNVCYVLSVCEEADPAVADARLAEILSLVQAQGDRIVGQETYRLSRPEPRTLLGKGKSREIAERARACGANLLVIDAELSPSQMRNLEDVAGIPISDREAIILNVFLQNANTSRAKIQVEIAQMEYLRPRIRGVGLNMDQQAGGIAGGRGAGETASELLARKIDGRLAEFRKRLAKLEKAGRIQRGQRSDCKRIVLVGYTNAGKTTLMNALTAETLSARNRPFETLDTTTRSLSRHGADVILSDTVGFIRRLPERLLASFESTLLEIHDASLLLIVVDVSDYEWKQHLEITEGLLAKLEADHIPRFYIFNKLDLTASVPFSEVLSAISKGFPWVALSGNDKDAVRVLRQTLLTRVLDAQSTDTLFVPYGAVDLLAQIYGKCRVLHSEQNSEGLTLSIEGSPEVIENIRSLSGRSAK